MKLVPFAAALALVSLAAVPVAAQQSAPAPGPATASVVVGDTSVVVSAELQRALDELAVTLDALGRRIANDPELRVAGLRVAQGMVGAAQMMVDVQTELLKVVLQRAADRLATIPVPESSR